MSNNIPFEVQSEIIKRLPVKSVLQCRSVSKEWKSLIDSSKFINDHNQIHQTQSQHHLFVRYKLGCIKKYISIVDDDTFPQKKFHLTAPLCVHLLSSGGSLLGSSNGLICFHGIYKDIGFKADMVALWNPAIKRSVGIVIPGEYTTIGFGVCPDTSDPKVVKINTIDLPIVHWYSDTHFIVSFDLKKEEFGVVCLPDSLVHSDVLKLFKRNESLVVVGYIIEAKDGTPACEVWEMKDGVTKSFNMMFSFKSSNPNEIASHREILGFRKNGEAIMERLFSDGDYDGQVGSLLEVYDPSSRRIVRIPIAGNARSFVLTSYIELTVVIYFFTTRMEKG